MRILLIEDDELLVHTLSKALTEQHYTVDVATDGQMGWDLAESFSYDLILLDVVLPKLNGIQLCQQLRRQGNQTPILLLTAQDTHTSLVTGLDAGADDYMAKPFDLQELLARIRALLRRSSTALPPLLQWRNLQLDPSTCEVTCNNQSLHLTPKEYGLLELFLRNRHRIFSCGALIDHLWSLEDPPTEETVRSHVKGLRQKLKAAGIADDPLETVYGIGYRLKPADPGKARVLDKGPDKPQPQRSAKPTDSAEQARLQAPQPGVEANQIWRQAKESLQRRAAVVEQATSLLLQEQLNEELRQQAEQEAHRLAGSLGMFGSEEGSRLAQDIEPLLAGGRSLNSNQRQRLSQLVRELRQTLQQMDRGLPDLLVAIRDERPWLLIVHGDRATAATLAAEAESRGLRAEIAASPTAARRRIAHHLPDAVLLDLPITSKQGQTLAPSALALLAEFSSYTPPVPVIVLTAQNRLIDRVQITRMGGQRILASPVAPVQAVDAVLQVLHHTRTEATRILAVDDDPQVLAALQTLLEPWGIKVTTLDDPLRFLDVLDLTSPDLLVLDVELPHVSGIELCQVVRNDPHWSGLPILVLTAHANAETMHRVFAAGADDYVSKPIVGPEFITRILNRLERSRLLRHLADIDALTGIANRRKSTQALTHWLQVEQPQPCCFAILDLDQLKSVNHRYGHAAGDHVLSRFGRLLRQTFPGEAVMGRWGGTEFVIGLTGLTQSEADQRLTELLDSLRQIEFAAAPEAFWVTCSIGAVLCPPAGADLQSVYRAADVALSQAKAAGGDRIIWGPVNLPVDTIPHLTPPANRRNPLTEDECSPS
ncbi:MAG: response regulator [Synechococcales cyanobacterium C42_A2020_086]|jgi:diguanylate cyclase (GGDEF)-like protein|nr:response regulator [Synechococcales cyanobacterium C42_A2020_086]